MSELTFDMLHELVRGRYGATDVPCPICGPDRQAQANRMRRVLRIWIAEHFATFNCARCGAHGYAHRQGSSGTAARAPTFRVDFEIDPDKAGRIASALTLWEASIPLVARQSSSRAEPVPTLGHKYLVERRGLHVGLLDDLSHCLRWHHGIGAVVALMTDALTGEPTGVHRTFLNRDGTKRERKMLGKQGVVRLSSTSSASTPLGICEGIEDGLAVLLSGFAPVWVATSAGAIAKFPVLDRVELTIFADSDEVGLNAARACAARWKRAGKHGAIRLPQGEKDWAEALRRAAA